MKLRAKLQNIILADKSTQEVLYSQAVLESKTTDGKSLRPSMEAGFHAFSSKKWVAHFHSLTSILMGEINKKELNHFQSWCLKYQWQSLIHFIPLTKPGWELSHYFQDNDSPINIIINHGVVLQSNDVSLLELWDKIEDQFLIDFNFSYLLEIKKLLKDNCSKNSNLSLISDVKASFDILKGPVRFYFPDMAIYFPKLENHLLQIEEGSFQLMPSASDDLKEIWIATQILYRSLPSLTEIPEEMTAEITQLPTEKLRQKFLK